MKEEKNKKNETVLNSITGTIKSNNADIEINDEEIEVAGIVSNCEKLYVRSKPITNCDTLTIINKNDKVRILDVNASTDFYKVLTTTGFEGFCMKKFINIKTIDDNNFNA